MLGKGRALAAGEKLKLLFAGYNGTRNTGSDVRVEEMLRQMRHILGAENVDFSVMTPEFRAFTAGISQGSEQVHLPDIFPPFLCREVPRHHGVVACEGSMFKSKFANALTTMMIGSLGLAAAQNKLSVGYGAEAGHMDPSIRKMCARYCQNSLVITRNEESRTILRELGVPTELGHRHGLDVRAAPARNMARRLCATRAGTARRRCWWCAPSIRLMAGEGLRGEVCRANADRGATKTATTARSIFTMPDPTPTGPCNTI